MRDRDQAVLDSIAGRRPNPRGIVRANCPFCEGVVGKVDKKQCLQFEPSGWWKCYRCDSRGKIAEEDVPYDTSTLVSSAQKAAEKAPLVKLPEGYVPLWTPEGQAVSLNRAWKYLKKERVGLTMEMIERARIGACVRGDFAGRIVIPIYKAGKLAGYVGRSWFKKAELKYRYSTGFSRADTIYNEEAIYVTSDEPVIVVEGCFDTFPFWPRGAAILGKLSPAQFEMLCQARRPILIAMDGDAHREGTAMAMQLRHAGKRAASLRLAPGQDPDEVAAWVKEQGHRAFTTGGY